MIPCNQIEALISAAIDDEVSDTELELLQIHISQCERCAQTSEAFIAVQQMLAHSRERTLIKPADRFAELSEIRQSGFSMWSIAGWSTAAVVLICIAISLAVQPRTAHARSIGEPLQTLNTINRMQEKTHRSMLQTCQWDLRTLKLELRQTELEPSESDALVSRIDQLLQRIESMQHLSTNSDSGAKR